MARLQESPGPGAYRCEPSVPIRISTQQGPNVSPHHRSGSPPHAAGSYPHGSGFLGSWRRSFLGGGPRGSPLHGSTSRPLFVAQSDAPNIGAVPLRVVGRDGAVSASHATPFQAHLVDSHAVGSEFHRAVEHTPTDDPPNLLWRRRSSFAPLPAATNRDSFLAPVPIAADARKSSVICAAPPGETGVVEVAVGKSSFAQTLFNACNVLLGIGVLSMPYAFRKAGWMAAGLLGFIAVVATYTAHLLGRIQRRAIVVEGTARADADGTADTVDGLYLREPGGDAGDERPERAVWRMRAGAEPRWELSWDAGKWRILPAGTDPHYQSRGWVSVPTKAVVPLRDDGVPLTRMDWFPVNGAKPQPAAVSETPLDLVHTGLLDAQRSQEQCAAEGPRVLALDQYPDIGRAAFGHRGHLVLQMFFFFEVFLFLISIVILVAQNLHKLTPSMGDKVLMCITAAACWPQALVRDFSRLTWLAYIGVVALLTLLFAVFWFAFTTDSDKPPGSGSVLPHHRATDQANFVPETWPLSFSLILSAYSGHSLLPSLYTDMDDPSKYGTVVNVSFAFCTVYYAVISTFGFLMFGGSADEILTLNFDKGSVVAKIALYVVAIAPYTKFGVNCNAVCTDLERTFAAVAGGQGSALAAEPGQCSCGAVALSLCVRSGVTALALLCALFLPGFATVMSLIGSVLTMTISIIVPCTAYLIVMGDEVGLLERTVNVTLVGFGVVLAVLGTLNVLGVDL
eukprot:TRINITY_DN8734_c0_g1_i1.p1 TRINITY_DN8734_c0_g1~~TRINITY_DN8734_c0_g1_i1.p1  ORF type:complete len:737 (+),score=137.52 TRINITY_DN8734_c0_g1_i1:96-2306(+)